jgi:hypothetical protein
MVKENTVFRSCRSGKSTAWVREAPLRSHFETNMSEISNSQFNQIFPPKLELVNITIKLRRRDWIWKS